MRLQIAAVAVILAWGVFAFGAVYPWGYQPLAIACALFGALALADGRVRAALPQSVVISLALVAAATLLQQVRIPTGILRQVSPATVTLIRQYDLSFAFGAAPPAHAVSIDPDRTWTGLLLLAAFGMFWMGTAGLLDEALAARIVEVVIVIGAAVALLAIAFAGNESGKVFGIWQPQSRSAPFGPFVNRNHYAGWMLMSTLAGFGYFVALVRGSQHTKIRSWRQRVIWWSTPAASRLIGVGAALGIMTLSVLLSMSRSGIVCLVLGLLAIAGWRGRRASRRWAVAVPLAGLVLFGAMAVGWVGADRMIARFGTWRDDSLEGRIAVWHDAAGVIGQFPLTGTGLNTFGVAMLFYQTSNLAEHYREAHNDYLQLAAEGGALVGIPVLALIGFTSAAARRRFRETDPASPAYWIRAGAVTGLLAAGIQEAGDFSLQMPGNAVLFCVLAGLALHRTGTPKTI